MPPEVFRDAILREPRLKKALFLSALAGTQDCEHLDNPRVKQGLPSA
jgi:hypothetical protein